jgi:predicted transcriptional regulator
MEIFVTPELEAKLRNLAAATGRKTEELIREALQTYLEHDQWFRNQVQQGLGQLDRGEFLSQEDVVNRIERLFHT